MDQDGGSRFKSLRAKFQDEIQARYRPAVPEKPKLLRKQAAAVPSEAPSSREDPKPPVTFLNFSSIRAGEAPRQTLKIQSHSSGGTSSLSGESSPDHKDTLEKARRKLLLCSRPKTIYLSSLRVLPTEGHASCSASSPVRLVGACRKTEPDMEVKALPELEKLGPSPPKPPRPPHVDISKYARPLRSAEGEQGLSGGTERPDFSWDPDSSLSLQHNQSGGVPSPEELKSGESEVREDGHAQSFPPDASFSQDGADSVYEDVELIPHKFSFSQTSLKNRRAPKSECVEEELRRRTNRACPSLIDPYAENGRAKEDSWRRKWSNATDEANASLRKEASSPAHHFEKEQKKREKQRLEKEKKEQKEKEKKRSQMRKIFKITGTEEPMYHARVLSAGKLRKYDLPVKSGDVISIIRTVSCPRGKWLARDANHKYGYVSVMNVELNIKEMLELSRRATQGQSDGDNISCGSRSSPQDLVLNISFTDDSEEWTYDEDTLSLSAENVAVETLRSDLSASLVSRVIGSSASDGSRAALSDGSTGDAHTQEEEHFQFADIDLLPPPALYAD